MQNAIAIAAILATLPGSRAVAESGGGMYETHRENMLDQALADTFPASDAVSVAQPGGGAETRVTRLAESEQRQPLERPTPNG